jgi:ribonuclease HI
LNTQTDLFAPVADRFTINADGGCRGNGSKNAVGGWGAYIVNHVTGEETDIFEGDKGVDVTNNRMELTAVIKGLLAVPQDAEILVVTDSQYVVKGMTEWLPGWVRRGWVKPDGKPVLNAELWKELHALASVRKKLRFEWVRGHSGHPGNERADELTNRAMDAIASKGK